MKHRAIRGMTLVEMLIAMAILGIVLLITSSGIIQSLQVNRLAEDAANTQSKLRRISEVISQELRSAVMGGLTNLPVNSDSSGISFALLSGDGGLPVTGNPHQLRTQVFASDPAALEELVGAPALIIDGAGTAILIDEIDNTSGSELYHDSCAIIKNHPVNTRLYSASALGFSYNADTQILSQHTLDQHGLQEVPFAFGLSRFEIAYEYDAGGGNTQVLNAPAPSGSPHFPSPEFDQGGETYQLARLRLTIASNSEDDDIEREYVSYIELSGIGNDARQTRTIARFEPCGTFVAETPPGEPDPGSGGSPGTGDPGDPGEPDNPSDPGEPGGGDDDDDDDDNDDDRNEGCGKRWWSC